MGFVSSGVLTCISPVSNDIMFFSACPYLTSIGHLQWSVFSNFGHFFELISNFWALKVLISYICVFSDILFPCISWNSMACHFILAIFKIAILYLMKLIYQYFFFHRLCLRYILVVHLSLWSILSSFLYTLLIKALFFCIKLSSCSGIICWKDYPFPLNYLFSFVQNQLFI